VPFIHRAICHDLETPDPPFGDPDLHGEGLVLVRVSLQKALTTASRPPSASVMLGSMDEKLTTLERAFQLARAGRVKDVKEIRTILKREGYSVDQLQGPQLKLQLGKLIRDATNAPRP
jgi:hypothetical protein